MAVVKKKKKKKEVTVKLYGKSCPPSITKLSDSQYFCRYNKTIFRLVIFKFRSVYRTQSNVSYI